METETTTRSESPNGRKAIAEQILASEEIQKRNVRIPVSDLSRKINHLSKVV